MWTQSKITKSSKKVRHTMVGKQVWFRGRIWRVIAAHLSPQQASPWLILKRALGVEAVAKTHEVQEAFN